MSSPEKALNVISQMEGTVKAFFLEREVLEQLRDLEGNVRATLDIEVRNTGFEECLERQYVICVIKDHRFRLPPEPTVYLVGDDGTVMGEEIVPSNRDRLEGREDVIYLSQEFVIYPDRKPKSGEFFLMPPVSFPEVEELEGVENVLSCSPSALGDIVIKNRYGLEDDPQKASILIGFDLSD
ncbi:MAG: hypothetical protein ACLFUV_08775 [Methanomassiliicoccales archaeon]